MDKGVFLTNNVGSNVEFMNEVFSYDPRNLEQTPDITISKYIIALAQYLIYFNSEYNRAKVEVLQKQRFIDGVAGQLFTKEFLKGYKTKKDAYEAVVNNSEELTKIREEKRILNDELLLLEGQDRAISELIAALKRELTRRSNEFQTIKRERYT